MLSTPASIVRLLLLCALAGCADRTPAALPPALPLRLPVMLTLTGLPADAATVSVDANGNDAVPPFAAAFAGNAAPTVHLAAPAGDDVFALAFFDASGTLVLGGFGYGDVRAPDETFAVALGTSLLPPAAGRVSPQQAWAPAPVSAPADATTTGGILAFGLAAGAVDADAQANVSTAALPTTPQAGIGLDSVAIVAFGFTVTAGAALNAPLSLAGSSLLVDRALADRIASWSAGFAAGATPALDVARFDGVGYDRVGTVPFTLDGDALDLGAGASGIAWSGSFVVYVPFTSPATDGSGSAVLDIPAPAPIRCAPASVTAAIGQSTIVTCNEPGFVGSFAAVVADPAVASAVSPKLPDETFVVTGLHAGTTVLSLRDQASTPASTTVTIHVTTPGTL